MAAAPHAARSASRRDVLVPAFALLSAAVALAATGLLPVPFLPRDPLDCAALVLGLLALVLLASGSAVGAPRLRVVMLLLAALPFVVFARVETGIWAWPQVGWVVLAVLAATLLYARGDSSVAAGALIALGASAVLAVSGLSVLPAGWNGITHPVALESGGPACGHPAETRAGLRRGAPVMVRGGGVPPLARGPGPWWVRAHQEERPGPRPVVLLLDGSSRAPAPMQDGMTTVHASQIAFEHAFDLSPFDAVVVRERAWGEADPQGRAKARALAGFVRKGGLLVGPGPEHEWPATLGRSLREAGRSATRGAAGVRRLGLGRVVRASTQEDVREVLEEGLWVPAVGVRLLARDETPGWLPGLEPWSVRPAGRRTQGLLLWTHVCVLMLLTRLLPGGGSQLLGVMLSASAICVALTWTASGEPGFRAHGVVLDLGGAGGRRIEAVAIDAGRRGYLGTVAFEGGGVVSLRGGRLTPDGRVYVAPRRSAWVLRESDARGVLPGEPEDVAASVLRPLLLGEADPRRLRYGRMPRLPARVQGIGPLEALTLTYRAPED